MPKTNTKKHSSTRKRNRRIIRRPWLWALIIVIILVIVLIVVCKQSHQSTTQDPASATSSTTPISTPDSPEVPTQTGSSDIDKPIQYEGENPNTLPELTGAITLKNASNGKLVIVAVIDQYLEEPGTCTLSLKDSNGKTVRTATAAAHSDITSSVCDVLEANVSDLAAGTYQLDIKLSADNKQGNITGEVNL